MALSDKKVTEPSFLTLPFPSEYTPLFVVGFFYNTAASAHISQSLLLTEPPTNIPLPSYLLLHSLVHCLYSEGVKKKVNLFYLGDMCGFLITRLFELC